MSKRIASTLLLLGAALCIAPPLQAGVSDIQDAINKAGKQRMLTQKIMGSYAMLGMNFRVFRKICGSSSTPQEGIADEPD
ncbi:MAG: hypothetical protein AB2814_05725 [Candidatus Sedimenticola endophacoides]